MSTMPSKLPKQLFQHGKPWLVPNEGAIMNKFADILEKNVDMLAKLESATMGQPISVAKRMIMGPVALWRYYAGYAGQGCRRILPSR